MEIANRQIMIPLIVLAVSLLLAFGNVENLSRFSKCVCNVHDPRTIQNVSCSSKSINRTFSMANMQANVTQVLNNVMLNIQLFKRTDVKYRPFLVTNVSEDYCAFFTKNKASKYLRILWSIYMPYTNLNHSCPYFGEVFIKGVPMNSKALPSIWPTGDYRLDILILEGTRKLMTMEFFVEIAEKQKFGG